MCVCEAGRGKKRCGLVEPGGTGLWCSPEAQPHIKTTSMKQTYKSSCIDETKDTEVQVLREQRGERRRGCAVELKKKWIKKETRG